MKRGGGLNACSVFRLIVLVALLVFLGFIVGPGEMRRPSSRSPSPSV